MTPTTAAPLSTAAFALDESYAHLALDLIDPSKVQPRTIFPTDYLEQLKVSVAEKGVLEPILVRPRPKGRFEIVAGECRTRAAKLAGLTHIPAVIRSYTDEQVLEIQLEENIHRKNLTPLEEAVAYRRLIATNPDKHSAATIATRIGMSVTYVWDYLKLNDLIPEAKKILAAEKMAVGHAILLARLKPEDQERAIEYDDDSSTQYRERGLWRADQSIDFDEDDAGKKKGDKYAGLKPCSVRELEAWIKNHVRFDVAHAAKAQPLVFEQTAAKVEEAAAKPGRGKKVISITREYRVADDARDDKERTYGEQSWQRADGQEKSKTCEFSVLGVFAAGEDYGQTLEVCVNRDKCLVHFGDVVRARQKAVKQREAGQTKKAAKTEKKAEESYDAKYRRQQAEQNARVKAWGEIAPFILADAVAQVKPVKALTPKLAAALLKDVSAGFSSSEIKKHGGPNWFKSLVPTLLAAAVGGFHYASYNKKSGFDDFIADIAKPYGLNIKRLEAIRDKHQPKAAAAPAKKAN